MQSDQKGFWTAHSFSTDSAVPQPNGPPIMTQRNFLFQSSKSLGMVGVSCSMIKGFWALWSRVYAAGRKILSFFQMINLHHQSILKFILRFFEGNIDTCQQIYPYDHVQVMSLSSIDSDAIWSSDYLRRTSRSALWQAVNHPLAYGTLFFSKKHSSYNTFS